MSWFTSLYPQQHKITNKYSAYDSQNQILSNLADLSPTAVTLAEIMKEHGYATVGYTGDAGVSGSFGFDQGFDIYYDNTTFGGFNFLMPMAIEWLTNNKDKKFFMFLQGYDVHGRHQIMPEFNNPFDDEKYIGKYSGTITEYWSLRNKSVDGGVIEIKRHDIEYWRKWYDERIRLADDSFGSFIQELKKLGLDKKTIIIVSSGSGNEYYEHEHFDHGLTLYDEVVRVPLIISMPDARPHEIDQQVSTLDIMPTILELVDIPYDERLTKQIQGISLVPLMEGEHIERDMYAETDYLYRAFKRMIRTYDGWKYIYSLDSEARELYNIKQDPRELINLIDLEQDIATECEQKIVHHFNLIPSEKEAS